MCVRACVCTRVRVCALCKCMRAHAPVHVLLARPLHGLDDPVHLEDGHKVQQQRLGVGSSSSVWAVACGWGAVACATRRGLCTSASAAAAHACTPTMLWHAAAACHMCTCGARGGGPHPQQPVAQVARVELLEEAAGGALVHGAQHLGLCHLQVEAARVRRATGGMWHARARVAACMPRARALARGPCTGARSRACLLLHCGLVLACCTVRAAAAATYS